MEKKSKENTDLFKSYQSYQVAGKWENYQEHQEQEREEMRENLKITKPERRYSILPN